MKIICVGRNYPDHIKELGNKQLEDIVFFFKPDTSLTKDEEDFYLPDFSTDCRYECELVVKIDKVGKSIPQAFAHNYYSFVTLGIDYTLTDWQQKAKDNALPWSISKGFDYSAPIGKWIPIKDLGKEIGDLNFCLKINNLIVQKANTSQMLHNIDSLIAYISQFITLKTGDIIFTGTPSGVGSIHIGDQLEGYLEDRLVFSQSIK